MSETFDKLKAALQQKGTLTEEEIAQAVSQYGAMTPEENMALSAEMHERQRAAQQTVTMEQYLAATKVLETAPQGSPEYVAAEKIVKQFEEAG